MAEVIEDPKKKKASFGDAAAAATDPGITQLNVGRPGDFPVNPDGTPMQKMAAGALPPAALPPAAPAYVPGSLPKIGQEVPLAPGVQQGLANQTAMYVTGAQAAAASRPPVSIPESPAVVAPQEGGAAFGVPPSMGRRPAQAISAPGVPAGAVPLEQRVGWRTDAVMNGAAEDASAAFKKGNYGETAGALVRGAATAIPAAAIDFGEGLAGGIVPGVKGFFSGLTGGQPVPAAQAQAAAPAAAPKVIPGAGDAAMPGNDPTRFMAPAQSDAPNPTAEGKDVGFGVRRIDAPGKSPLFTNVASAADNAALQGRGSISAQNMGAAQGLSDTFAAEGRAAAQKAQYDQEVATAQAINARLIPKDTGGYGLLSKEYQDRRNASFAPSSLVGDTARNAAIIAQGAALDAQALQGVRNEGEAARAEIHEGGSNSRAALQEQGQNTRFGALQTIAKQRLALDSKTQGAQAAQYGAEARLKGVQANAAEQLAALQNKYMAAKPEEQAAIAKQIRTLSNKADKAQLLAVNQPDTMAPDGMTKLGGGQRLVVQGEDGSFREVPMGGEQAAGISADARAIAIRDNKSMSVDEKRKQLQALGYK